MKRYFIAGSISGICMSILVLGLFTLQNGYTSGLLLGSLAAGVFSGFLFAIMFFVFVENMKSKIKLVNSELMQFEEILKEDAANHFIGYSSNGGKLFLTNYRLIFKAHGANLKTYNMQFQLNELDDIQIWNILGLIPYGLKVFQEENCERFMVFDPRQWLREIKVVFKELKKNN